MLSSWGNFAILPINRTTQNIHSRKHLLIFRNRTLSLSLCVKTDMTEVIPFLDRKMKVKVVFIMTLISKQYNSFWVNCIDLPQLPCLQFLFIRVCKIILKLDLRNRFILTVNLEKLLLIHNTTDRSLTSVRLLDLERKLVARVTEKKYIYRAFGILPMVPLEILPLVANGTIGNTRTLNVSRLPMVPLVPMLPLVETLVPMVPLVVPMVPLVSPMVSTVV